jgi:hypothetical protein
VGGLNGVQVEAGAGEVGGPGVEDGVAQPVELRPVPDHIPDPDEPDVAEIDEAGLNDRHRREVSKVERISLDPKSGEPLELIHQSLRNDPEVADGTVDR